MSGCCDRILLELVATAPASATESRRQIFEDRAALLRRRMRKFRRQQVADQASIFRFTPSHLTSLYWRKRA